MGISEAPHRESCQVVQLSGLGAVYGLVRMQVTRTQNVVPDSICKKIYNALVLLIVFFSEKLVIDGP